MRSVFTADLAEPEAELGCSIQNNRRMRMRQHLEVVLVLRIEGFLNIQPGMNPYGSFAHGHGSNGRELEGYRELIDLLRLHGETGSQQNLGNGCLYMALGIVMLLHVTGLDEGIHIINLLIHTAALNADNSAECITGPYYILVKHEVHLSGTDSGACEHSFKHGHCCESPPYR